VPIASVTEFKTHLGLSGTGQRMRLYTTYLNQASAIIARKTGFAFDSARQRLSSIKVQALISSY
jgi:hypothetical protein